MGGFFYPTPATALLAVWRIVLRPSCAGCAIGVNPVRGMQMAVFIKREFTWAEGARKSSVRFTVRIAPVSSESTERTTQRFKQEAARLAQAFVKEHEAAQLRESIDGRAHVPA